jgi:hypothetical protein
MIDFIIPWVNGDDPKWKSEFFKYSELDGDKRNVRYRDWDNLQYWFRGVETFAPWVNKIHFITWGHYPKWLNIHHPKLNLVKHSDYIPMEYLPTFSSRTIELNMHRIKGLAEQFVYFNDDMFLLKPTKPDFFFKNGLPCDIAAFNILFANDILSHTMLNEVGIINKNFKKNEVVYKHFFKWINLKYGKYLFRTLCLLPCPKFTGFYNPHQPQPFLKSIIQTIWEKEEDILQNTCKSKFRCVTGVNQYLFRYWQLVCGSFTPVSCSNRGIMVDYKDDNKDEINDILLKQKSPLLCINDGNITDFESAKCLINKAFNTILPNKSSYEISETQITNIL